MKITTWLMSIVLLIVLTSVWAQMANTKPIQNYASSSSEKLVRSKGMAEIQFEGSEPTQQQKKSAYFQAKENSVERYLTKYRPAAREVLANCPLTESSIDKVVIDSRSKPAKKSDGMYRVAMRTSIDTVRLDSYLQHCGGTTADRIAIVLVARKAIGDNHRKTYKAFFGQLDKALADVFTSKNFNVDSQQDMEVFSGGLYRKGRLMKQYEHAGQVNWEPAQIAGYMNNIDLLVVGYFDIANIQKVKLNNLLEVTVSGSAEMFDLASKKVVSSTNKIQLRAEAATETDVINEAVQMVVDEMGLQLTDQLIAYTMSN